MPICAYIPLFVYHYFPNRDEKVTQMDDINIPAGYIYIYICILQAVCTVIFSSLVSRITNYQTLSSDDVNMRDDENEDDEDTTSRKDIGMFWDKR